MEKEHKIFLSVCGSILAIVAIAIFLSFGSGDSYAESSSDYGCTYTGWWVAGSDTDGTYKCCPDGYTLWAKQKDTTTGEWIDATCGKNFGTQSSSFTCPAIGGGQNATYYSTSLSTYKWAGYCITAPQAAKKTACYYCPANYTAKFSVGAPSDTCPTGPNGSHGWEEKSGVSEANCKVYTISYSYQGLSTTLETYHFYNTSTTLLPAQTRSGYTFSYYEDVDFPTNHYPAGYTITVTHNKELYAVYVKDDSGDNSGGGSTPAVTYTISYNANGGSGAPSSQTKTHDVDLTLSSTKPTKTGYTFKGWATSSTATTATYQPGGKYTSNASTTLYAVWEASKYTIKYDANEGKDAPKDQTKDAGKDIKLSSEEPTRDEYFFAGWNTKKDGTGNSYLPGATYSKDENVTLYAQWDEIKLYNILYIIDEENNMQEFDSYPEGTDAYISKIEIKKEGYTFREWNTKEDGTGKTYKPGETYKDNKDLILYAIWDANATNDEITVNSKTGNTLILVALTTGLAALCYMLLYTKRMKSNN